MVFIVIESPCDNCRACPALLSVEPTQFETTPPSLMYIVSTWNNYFLPVYSPTSDAAESLDEDDDEHSSWWYHQWWQYNVYTTEYL